MGTLIFFFVLSILFSFLCSVWEAVLLSITPSYTARKVQEGGDLGRSLQLYKNDIDKPLSAILSLNTIAHTVGAIGVGAQAGKLYGETELTLGPIHLTYESLIAGAMTLAILFLSEIIPKTIGANRWKDLAPFTIRSIRVLMIVMGPLVWISQWLTTHLKREKDRSVLSRADFQAITEVGLQSGALEKSESTIIQNLLRLDNLHVTSIMTPRSVVLTASEDETVEGFYSSRDDLPFSRIPVYKDNVDNITGMVLKDDLLQKVADDQHNTKLSEIRREIMFLNQTMELDDALKSLIRSREHMAMVVDDFGGVIGLVTMEDIFETILGYEIVDESDNVENLQAYARKLWKERAERLGLIPIEAHEEQSDTTNEDE